MGFFMNKFFVLITVSSVSLLTAADYTNTNQAMTNQAMTNQAMTLTATDQEIATQVRDTLKGGWFGKSFDKVNFDVTHGTVTLRGNVESLKDKTSLEDKIRKIQGVKQVINQIVSTNNEVSLNNDAMAATAAHPDFAATDDDRALNAKIREKLKGGWLSKGYDTIILRTNNGIVIISGFVEKPEDVQKVSDKVKEVDGVKGVNNLVTVQQTK